MLPHDLPTAPRVIRTERMGPGHWPVNPYPKLIQLWYRIPASRRQAELRAGCSVCERQGAKERRNLRETHVARIGSDHSADSFATGRYLPNFR